MRAGGSQESLVRGALNNVFSTPLCKYYPICNLAGVRLCVVWCVLASVSEFPPRKKETTHSCI